MRRGEGKGKGKVNAEFAFLSLHMHASDMMMGQIAIERVVHDRHVDIDE